MDFEETVQNHGFDLEEMYKSGYNALKKHMEL